jgi:3-oxoacyl-[acyl-carrier-protein] synthase III
MKASIAAITYALPERVLTNDALAEKFPDWCLAKVAEKTGIQERRIAADDECASDLAFRAAEQLFSSEVCHPEDIDYLLVCTQTPDYLLPGTGCLLQHRLGLRQEVGATDINLGCSGYVYALSLAQGLIESGQARRVLLLTADTYSKLIRPADRSVRTLFGDGAAATLLRAGGERGDLAPAYVFGTDGSGAHNLIATRNGFRDRLPKESTSNEGNLYMNGPEIFDFALRRVPACADELIKKTGHTFDDVALFVFHQASLRVLLQLGKKMGIPEDKCYVWLSRCGNTVSSSIPIALVHAIHERKVTPGNLIMMIGFGVGYSWAATLVRWPHLGCEPMQRHSAGA